MKKGTYIIVAIAAICIGLHSCENSKSNNESSTESTSQIKDNDNIINKVKILSTKQETTYSMRYLDVTIKNISNENLGKQQIPIMVRYEDGTVERKNISTPVFLSGDTHSWAIESKKYPTSRAVACELAPN